MKIGIPREYKSIRLFLKLVICLSIVACLYALFGEQIIRDLFQGKFPFTSYTLFTSAPEQPLEYYINRTNRIIWDYLVIGFPLTILLWALVLKALKYIADSDSNKNNLADLVPERRFKYDTVIAFAVYCLLTVVISYPILGSFSSTLIGPPEDNLQFYWNYWWMTENVMNGTGSLMFTNYLFFPEGAQLYYHSWTFYNLAISVVLSQFMNLHAVSNLIALHSFPVAGIGAFLLVRYLTRNSYIALIGGFMFAFCPYHSTRLLHHLNLMSIQFIPFFVLFYIKAIRRQGRWSIILAAVFLLLNALCSWTYLIFALLFMFLCYVYLAIRRKRIFLHDVAVKASVIAGSVLLVLSPWLWQMVRLAFTGAGIYEVGRKKFVTDVFGLFVPGYNHWLSNLGFIESINSSFTGNAWEATTYLGIPAIIIVLIASFRIMPVLGRYLTAVLAFAILSFGYDLHILGHSVEMVLPDVLLSRLPLISNVRAPSRYIIYVYLFWGILVSVATGYLIYAAKNRRLRRVLIMLLPLLLLIDFVRPINEISYVPLPACYQKVLESQDRTAVLDLPADAIKSRYYMYYQAGHEHPIVQGWISRKCDTTLIDWLEYEDLDVQKQQLAEAGVRYIMIHKEFNSGNHVPEESYREMYRVACEDSTHILLEVD